MHQAARQPLGSRSPPPGLSAGLPQLSQGILARLSPCLRCPYPLPPAPRPTTAASRHTNATIAPQGQTVIGSLTTGTDSGTAGASPSTDMGPHPLARSLETQCGLPGAVLCKLQLLRALPARRCPQRPASGELQRCKQLTLAHLGSSLLSEHQEDVLHHSSILCLALKTCVCLSLYSPLKALGRACHLRNPAGNHRRQMLRYGRLIEADKGISKAFNVGGMRVSDSKA